MARGVPGLATSACGEGAIAAAMAAAVAMGATRGTAISYAHSGDALIGDPSGVVGYGAVAMTAGERGSDVTALARTVAADAGAPLQPRDGTALLALARETIRRYLTTDTVPLVRDDNRRLLRSNGVFVTLRKQGELRGCVGRLVPEVPLARLTGLMALESALSDPRFTKVSAGELSEIQIEISVLTPLKPIPDPAAIVIGRDGVVLAKNGQSAVFLPSVAVEQGWDRDQLLDNLALKAGLPRDGWRAGAQLLVFQAEVFAENSPARPEPRVSPRGPSAP
jgi:hypothetical protein